MPTDLHAAIGSRNIALIEKLLNGGADVNALNEQGYSPLHLAVTNADWQIIELLIQNGAKLDIHDSEGRTPIDIARRSKPYLVDLIEEAINQKVSEKEVEGKSKEIINNIQSNEKKLQHTSQLSNSQETITSGKNLNPIHKYIALIIIVIAILVYKMGPEWLNKLINSPKVDISMTDFTLYRTDYNLYANIPGSLTDTFEFYVTLKNNTNESVNLGTLNIEGSPLKKKSEHIGKPIGPGQTLSIHIQSDTVIFSDPNLRRLAGDMSFVLKAVLYDPQGKQINWTRASVKIK